jgi:hypothetical protein
MKNLIAALFTVTIISNINAQVSKHTTTLEQVWLGYFNQTRFSDHWGMWADLHLRTKDDFIKDLSQGIARVGLTYYLHDATKLTAGYAFVNNFPGDNHKNISQPENRLWQQLQWHTKYKKVRTMQWLRLEEKFRHKILNDSTLADGYNFNWKIRYNFFYQVPLSKKGFAPNTLSFVLNE